MMLSKRKYKRVKPLLGTYFAFALDSEEDGDKFSQKAFERGTQLESLFSRFTRSHEKEKEPLFQSLIHLAREIEEYSNGAFEIGGQGNWDLDGVAKGFIIDCIIDEFNQAEPGLSGYINVGGDLRFFNSPSEVRLKLGPVENPKFKTVLPNKTSLAVSQINRSLEDPTSTTRYKRNISFDYTADHGFVVEADNCWVADAMTKVLLFGSKEIIMKCCHRFKALAYVFDPSGNLVASYGQNEVHL